MGTWLPTLVRRGRLVVAGLALLATTPLGEASPKLVAAPEPHGAAPALPPIAKRTVLVELTEESSSAAYDRVVAGVADPTERDRRAGRQAAKLQAVKVQRQQDRLAAILSDPPFNAGLLYRSERTSNRLAIQIDPAHVARVRSLPGVRSAQVVP
jgi:hypothetical protein